MNTEAQRVAIAKACPNWRVGDESGMSMLVHWTDSNGTQMLSDPLSDLNAMHEAEKVIEEMKLCVEYVNNLRDFAIYPKTLSRYGLTHATAAQRAEAFLRTLNLWTES